MQTLGKLLVIAGSVAVVAGMLLWLFPDRVNWLGNLPGDLKIKGKNYGIYFPLGTSLFLSVILSAILWIIGKLMR
ncbi:hypothetical protein FUAX_20270 [Fulvitalea axinellae]|uniref:DUF2905 domain-containing protein n=1 Tax=Fulvitalea axinellae TaxID=1182444 RepID=A0AAU9DF48_9BACT|nr:hypothetical protein FUAX_20270 [Fulvitalea axinellae]